MVNVFLQIEEQNFKLKCKHMKRFTVFPDWKVVTVGKVRYW